MVVAYVLCKMVLALEAVLASISETIVSSRISYSDMQHIWKQRNKGTLTRDNVDMDA